MKKYFFCLITLFLLNSSLNAMNNWRFEIKKDTVPNNDLTLQYLTHVDLVSFLNKPIDSFLVSVNKVSSSINVSSCGSTKEAYNLACYLQVEYGTSQVKDFTIRFYVKDYVNMNRYDPNHSWSTSLMRQQKIWRIDIFYLWEKINSASL